MILGAVLDEEGRPICTDMKPGNTVDLKAFLPIVDRLRKIREEERYDGLFVLRTNTKLSTEQVALQYKRLLLVERFFRDTKSLIDTRPIFHHWDTTIMGNVFVSFLRWSSRMNFYAGSGRKAITANGPTFSAI